MGATIFTELRAWQLANRLKKEVLRLTAAPLAATDVRFCNDIRAAAASVSANIAEGFGRFTHAEFARFVVIARGSLTETQNHLLDAKDRGYLDSASFDRAWKLALDAMRILTALHTYLTTHPTPPLTRD